MNATLISIRNEVVPLPSGGTVLLLICSGKYRIGSSGKPDAKKIYDEACQLLRDKGANRLLLDYSGLDYEWGDDLWLTFQINHPDKDKELPFAVVVGPKCEEAIRSLLEDDGGFESWLDSGYIFHDTGAALKSLSVVDAEHVAAAERPQSGAR
jgi:hypothetical protein